jgi:integration host factor subunit beta
MVKSDLIAFLKEAQPAMSLGEADKIISLLFDGISQRLAEGGRVELRGFGAFSTRAREGREGRDPRSREIIEVAPKRVPFFKPAKEMRERVNR